MNESKHVKRKKQVLKTIVEYLLNPKNKLDILKT